VTTLTINEQDEHTEATLTAAIMKKWAGVKSQGGMRYVVAVQVNNGAGFAFGRTLDAIVLDTWPSKGLTLHGLEVKCSKGDLRRELQNPAKAEGFLPYLDNFSIVAPSNVIDRDLIPKRWGIYVPDNEGSLRTVRSPLYLHDDGRDREHVDRSLMAAFARALVQRSLSKEARDEEYECGYRAGQQSNAAEIREAEMLRQRQADFEAASGVRLGDWSGPQMIGEAVEFVLHGGLQRQVAYVGDMRKLGQKLMETADELERLAEATTLEVKSL